MGMAAEDALAAAAWLFSLLPVVPTAEEAIAFALAMGASSPGVHARDIPANAETASAGPALTSITASSTSVCTQASVIRTRAK